MFEEDEIKMKDKLVEEMMGEHNLPFEISLELVERALDRLPDHLKSFENYLRHEGFSEEEIALIQEMHDNGELDEDLEEEQA